jgi:RsiW-degrading membrane proteinase PrsW (M82 family)
MIQGLVVFAGAVIPAILTVLWFRARDRERMAAGLVWEAFCVGACSGLLVIAALRLSGLDFARLPPVISAWLNAFVGAGIPEELAKLVVIAVVARRHIDRCFPHDFIIVAAAVAGGFAALENIAYIMQAESQAATAFVRATLSVPLHIFCGILIGAGLALHEMQRGLLWPVLGLVTAIVFHGLFDFPLMLAERAAELPGTPWQRIAGGRIPTGLVLIEALIAAALSAYVLRHETRAISRPDSPEPSPWQPRLLVIELIAWLLLGLLLLAAAALFLLVVIRSSDVFMLPLIGILLLYACGALYQVRSLSAARRRHRLAALSQPSAG